MTSGNPTRFFFELTPDRVLEAVEASGLACTGRCMALNSFENRVYDVELESEELRGSSRPRVVTKFYRPGRWSERQILEEHEFIADLVADEIPAIAPLPFPGGGTLRRTAGSGIYYSIFPRVGGRAPDELSGEQLRRIGRLIARMHGVGSSKPAPGRVRLGPETYGRSSLRFLLEGPWIPLEFRARYQSAAEAIIEASDKLFAERAGDPIRLHGDCHLGNLLLNQDGPFFLDFDDMVTGPAVQDLWLLIPEREGAGRAQLESLLEGYEEMRAFDRAELALIEPLRALRFLHYTAWIARRWEDPAFPAAFPQFGSHRYWSDETDDLENQLALISRLSSS